MVKYIYTYIECFFTPFVCMHSEGVRVRVRVRVRVAASYIIAVLPIYCIVTILKC